MTVRTLHRKKKKGKDRIVKRNIARLIIKRKDSIKLGGQDIENKLIIQLKISETK